MVQHRDYRVLLSCQETLLAVVGTADLDMYSLDKYRVSGASTFRNDAGQEPRGADPAIDNIAGRDVLLTSNTNKF